MNEKEFLAEIVTPERQVFQGNLVALMLPGTEGLFQILVNHAPLIATLEKGSLRLDRADGNSESIRIAGGVVEVNNNKVIVLAERVIATTVEDEEAEAIV